jgi:hypothetical protein
MLHDNILKPQNMESINNMANLKKIKIMGFKVPNFHQKILNDSFSKLKVDLAKVEKQGISIERKLLNISK